MKPQDLLNVNKYYPAAELSRERLSSRNSRRLSNWYSSIHTQLDYIILAFSYTFVLIKYEKIIRRIFVL